MHSTSIPLFLIVASLASTSLGLHPLILTARRSLETILPRQTDFGPCNTACASIQSAVTNCSTVGCLCTTAVATSLQACINCAISFSPSISVVSSAQSLIDTFDTTCSAVTGLPSVTIATGTAPNTLNTSPVSFSTAPVGSISLSMSTIIVVPTTITQITVQPSSTPSATSTALNVGNTGFPLQSNALPSKMVSHWTGALVGLVVGNLLAF